MPPVVTWKHEDKKRRVVKKTPPPPKQEEPPEPPSLPTLQKTKSEVQLRRRRRQPKAAPVVRRRVKSAVVPQRPILDDWENEVARKILILHKSEPDVDFAIDDDAVARPRQASKQLVNPIWFLGNGELGADWTALGEDTPSKLKALDEAGDYEGYVGVVRADLHAALETLDDDSRPLFNELWRQMVVAAVVFGTRCVDDKRFADALQLLEMAQIAAAEHVPRRDAAQLAAFVDDAHAYYYFRRAKHNAALVFAMRAMRAHVKLNDWAHVAKCHVHCAAVLSRMRRHPEAARCLGQVLHLVNTNKLDHKDGAPPQHLCMIAVCYHNLAVEQLRLNHAPEAAVSAQNARRIARLCLSYANRWLHNFEATHKAATDQVRGLLDPLTTNYLS